MTSKLSSLLAVVTGRLAKKKPLKKELFDSCTPIDSDGNLQIVPNQNFTTVTWTKSGFLPFSELLGIEIVRASCWDQ